MCMVLYLGSDKALPLIEWKEESPAFYVCELSENERVVEKQFNRKYVYYLGSHQGCGCGFSYGQIPVENQKDIDEENAAKESVKRLSQYLSKAIEPDDSLDLYSCWSGDEESTPQHYSSITPNDIGGSEFSFQEKVFIVVNPPL